MSKERGIPIVPLEPLVAWPSESTFFTPKNRACVRGTSLSMVDNTGTLQVVCCLGRAHLVNESLQPADSVERSIRCIGLSVHSKSLKKHAFMSDTQLYE
jgi:hypothetical protein